MHPRLWRVSAAEHAARDALPLAAAGGVTPVAGRVTPQRAHVTLLGLGVTLGRPRSAACLAQ